MADATPIEWTDATWNPIGGCTRVSEGCRNCYAEVMAARFSGPGQWGEGLARIVRDADGKAIDHRWTGQMRFNDRALDLPLRWRKPRRIFVNSTSDLFHENVPDEWIDKVFAVMALASQHTFQVLTKRPERAREYMDGRRANFGRASDFLADMEHSLSEDDHQDAVDRLDLFDSMGKPLSNLWLGTSIEDQATANARIPHLLNTPAAVRFVSAEPLLGPVSLDDMCDGTKFIDALRGKWWHDTEPPYIEGGKPRLDWVIVGGESGPGARPVHPDWARSLRDQCQAAGVAFHFKQWGAWGPSTETEAAGNPHSGWQCLAGHPHVARVHELHPEAGAAFMERKGKARAGRLLDGREWNDMPGVRG